MLTVSFALLAILLFIFCRFLWRFACDRLSENFKSPESIEELNGPPKLILIEAANPSLGREHGNPRPLDVLAYWAALLCACPVHKIHMTDYLGDCASEENVGNLVKGVVCDVESLIQEGKRGPNSL